MRQVKLLKIVEENVLCEKDHLVCRYLDHNSWTPVCDGEVINAQLSLQQYVVPIKKYCKASFEPQEGVVYDQGYRDRDQPYVHTTYVAIDHHNSPFFKDWINEQTEVQNHYYKQWTSAEEKIIDLKFSLRMAKNASFWRRLKWLFTGVQVG